MSAFQTGTLCALKLDPLKRVNYTFGLVLGVDEFQQEQTYFLSKDRSHYRLAHGYGTIRGLQVQVVTTPDLEVQVSPGVAISPAGQEIHVPQLMCAKLNDWLSNNQAQLAGLVDSSQPLSLCLVLGYRECATDTVPVPGEPCRTQQDAMAPSHLADSFQLKLCLNADWLTSPPMSPASNGLQTSGLCCRPRQREENATRRFGELLHRIRITDNALVFTQEADLENLVRTIETLEGPCTPPSSPPSSPPGSPPSSPPGSPPWDTGPIYLATETAPEFLRAAFRVWVTEVLPAIAAKNAQSGCACDPSLLLAELQFSINNNWQVTGPVTIDESCRPILVETRLLQECLINEITGEAGAGAAQTSVVVAAGTFNVAISGGNVVATASGPVYNNISATGQARQGLLLPVLLTWSGNPGYVNPLSSPPSGHSYVVKGTAIAGTAIGAYGFQIMGFQNNGILIALTGEAKGFCVEISEITA